MNDLHLVTRVPENNTKCKTDENCQEQTNSIIFWAPPVRPMLFPETRSALGNKWLGVLGWER